MIPKPRNQARSTRSGGGSNSDSLCKEIDAEDVGTTTPCGRPADMDLSPPLNATSSMKLWNQSILNPRYQARSASSGGVSDSDSISEPQF